MINLNDSDLNALFEHSALGTNLRLIIQHVTDLRECVSAKDFYDFQRQLLVDAYQVDNRRAECTKSSRG